MHRDTDSAVVSKEAAGAPETEIEITPEMIEAGVMALSLCEPHDSRASTARDVFIAMEAVRTRSSGYPE
jgi:hypothetical protein